MVPCRDARHGSEEFVRVEYRTEGSSRAIFRSSGARLKAKSYAFAHTASHTEVKALAEALPVAAESILKGHK